MKPRLLDLFCGAGGAAMGYARAGFEVVGVDINPQKYYPFEFHQGDAMTWPLEGFDAIHASPPCQAYSSLRSLFGKRNYGEQNAPPDLLPGMLARLAEWGNVWVVENVVGAPVPDPFMLCGSSFGLEVRRHRLFASPLLLMGLPCRHDVQGTPTGVYDSGGWEMRKSKKVARTRDEARRVMEMPWSDYRGCTQAIPPAYTEFIGQQLLQHLNLGSPANE